MGTLDDERKALAAADAIIAEHGYAHMSERYRLVLALAYLQGSRDGMIETAARGEAALTQLAADLTAAAVPS